MKQALKILSLALILFLSFSTIYGQEEEWENPWEAMLIQEVENPNPVYKPVLGFGFGWLTYLGDIQDNYTRVISGAPGIKFNINTFLDKKHFTKLNFAGLYGSLVVNHRDPQSSLPEDNLNMKSEIFTFGINLEYNFGNFTSARPRVRPYISMGIEAFNFTSKTNLMDANGNTYYYWNDGTIHNLPQTHPNALTSSILTLDNDYETDMYNQYRRLTTSSYAQVSASIPLDFGFDFVISDRAIVRFGTSLHYTFTDFVDNITPEAITYNSNLTENGRNDMFAFTYVTFHMDMFSSKKTITQQFLFAMLDDDYTAMMFSDEDGDNILDFVDECPDTPPNVAVNDTTGCPLDDDFDGVYNYEDQEPNSRPGVLVGDDGVELTESVLAVQYGEVNAVTAERAYMIPLSRSWNRFSSSSGDLQIPEKFKRIDADGDGFLTFKEVLGAIDLFFDEDSGYVPEDMYELNEFFFAQ